MTPVLPATVSPRRPVPAAIVRPEYVDHLLAAPNAELTPLRGNRLWQLGLLEMWLQEHGG